MDSSSFSPLFYRLLFVFVVGLCCFSCDARRPRAFVHIGPHKTGTTAIQTTLVHLAQDNKLPPGIRTFLGENPKGLAFFARAVMDETREHPHVFRVNSLLQEIDQKNTDIILSAEAFDMPSSVRATDKLSEMLKDYDVTIVAFLREPLAHLISYWVELTCRNFLVRGTLLDYLNRRLEDLKAASSFPPPYEVEEIVKYKMEMNGMFNDKQRREGLMIEGGKGWELFRTLDLYRHSFNVTTKKEKEKKKKEKKKEKKVKKKKKREEEFKEEEEGGNKIVLIDYDGVLASEKTLVGVFLNEVVGLEDINTEDLHQNSHVNEKGSQHWFLTAINIKDFYAKYRRKEERFGGCHSVVNDTVKIREELEARGGLKACSEVIDFDNMKRELDDYFSKKLEESGFEVLYGGKGKKWTGVKNCYLVDEQVADSIAQMKKEEKALRKEQKKAEKEGKKQSEEKEKREKEKRELDGAWGEVWELEEKVQEKERKLKERQRKWEMEMDM